MLRLQESLITLSKLVASLCWAQGNIWGKTAENANFPCFWASEALFRSQIMGVSGKLANYFCKICIANAKYKTISRFQGGADFGLRRNPFFINLRKILLKTSKQYFSAHLRFKGAEHADFSPLVLPLPLHTNRGKPPRKFRHLMKIPMFFMYINITTSPLQFVN